MKIVEVTWRDIQMDGGWHTSGQLDKFITDQESKTVMHVGYLYEDDEDQIVLLDAYFLDRSSFGTVHTIPKGCILNIKELSG